MTDRTDVTAAEMLDADASYVARWQRTLLLTIPVGVIAFAAAWLLERPSGQATVFDAVAYPVMTVALIVAWALLALDARRLGVVVLAVGGGTGAFLLAKLSYLLFAGIEPQHVQAEMTESFFWVPAAYLLSFILPRAQVGRRIVLTFTFGILAVSLAYALWPGLPQRSLGVVYAVVQLNLSNAVLLALSLALVGFKETYTRNRTRMEAAERFAAIDALTTLPNHLSLQRHLARALAASRSSGTQIALLFIDIDGFKALNETFGHEAGDLVLQQLATRVQRVLRRGDFIARVSGDEFALLIEDVDEPRIATFVARKVQAELVAPFRVGEQSVSITVSIGISLFPDDAGDAEALLRRADSAMHRVKTSGKNGVQQYRRDTDERLELRRDMARELRQAVERDEMHVAYQPLHDLATGEVRKFEALLRWGHPRLGAVSPVDFIPIAEASGQIIELGTWVLHRACRQAKVWERSAAGNLQVSVNVSPLQFAQSGFYDTVVEALELSQLAPEALELELTESMVLHGVDHVTTTLRRLQRLGVSIAIDDFGTGYSSLAYLRDLPIDTIKIDRSFISDLGTPRKGQPQFSLALVEAITHLAGHLGLEVVAEGIETHAQCELVRDLGCTTGQGFYFARPMTATEIDGYTRGRHATTDQAGRALAN